MRRFVPTLGLAAGLLAGPPAHAQQVTVSAPPQMVNPWNGGGSFTLPVIGRTPANTPVVDPWMTRFGGVTPATLAPQSAFGMQYSMWNAAGVWNPALYPYWQAAAAMNNPLAMNNFAPGAVNPAAAGLTPQGGVNPMAGVGRGVGFSPQTGLPIGPFTQIEPGRFSRTGFDLAVNRTTGTVLQPYSGVAYTNEGTFLRLPGSGTFTPWGAYVPGTGVFANPLTGALYNPQTGLILR